MSLLDYSKTYIPQYLDFVAITEEHERAHWHIGEVVLTSDIEQWKNGTITEKEKYFINSVLRLFTASDVAVGRNYFDILIPVFKNNEVRNMLSSFATREGTHQRAYALLSDSLGFGESFHLEFLEYEDMKEKYEFMLDMKNGSKKDIAIYLAKEIFIEGVCLFSSFACLLNFSRFGKMKGMCDANLWSLREEHTHSNGLSLLFNTFLKENPRIITDNFKKEIYLISHEVIRIEDNFIDRAFELGGVEGITKEQMKSYIRSMCDYRLECIGFKKQFNVLNELDWMDWLISSNASENFFETNTTNYSKGSMIGNYATGY